MTRGDEEIERVEDLDPDREVYFASRSGGPIRPVHLDNDCRFLSHAKNQFSGTARQVHSDRPVCRVCSGAADFGNESGTDPAAIRSKLAGLDPDDVGLSALGERPGGDR